MKPPLSILIDRFVPPTTAVVALMAIGMLSLGSGCASRNPSQQSLRSALTFYASFDHGADADFARGDSQVYHAKGMNERFAGTRGMPTTPEIHIEAGAGRYGSGLNFTKAQAPVIFYKAPGNVAIPPQDWSGTVSFWLSTDLVHQLPWGYSDPIQITSKAWNDAAFYTDFEKRTNGTSFRLGVCADLKVWNPNNRDWDKMVPPEKPLVLVENPPFAAGKWTHVAYTFEHFNTGKPDGVAKFYLNGELRGEVSARTQTFTWEPSKTLIMLGIGYVGRYDDLAIFDRSLSANEIKTLRDLPEGVSSLLR